MLTQAIKFISIAVLALLANLVFCLFNFRRRARCFAGDVGSVSMAYVLVFAIGMLMVSTQEYYWIMLLQLAISAGLIFLPVNPYLYSAIVLLLLCGAYLLFMKKYYHLHAEYLAQAEKKREL